MAVNLHRREHLKLSSFSLTQLLLFAFRSSLLCTACLLHIWRLFTRTDYEATCKSIIEQCCKHLWKLIFDLLKEFVNVWSCCRIVFCFHLMLIQMLARSQNISKAQSTIWIRHSKLSQTTKDRLTIKMFSTAPQVYHSPLKLFWKAIWPKRSLLATKGKSFHRTATHYDLLMMETKRISK